MPFVRPATGFPIGDSSLIRRRGISNRVSQRPPRVCYTSEFTPCKPEDRPASKLAFRVREEKVEGSAESESISKERKRRHLKREQLIDPSGARLFVCSNCRIKNIFFALLCWQDSREVYARITYGFVAKSPLFYTVL